MSQIHRIELEKAYVLHQRPYRESSLLVDLMTEQYGRITATAFNARGPKTRFRGQLQLYTPMLVSWSGRGDLVSLTQLELAGVPLRLTGQGLLCGFYVNELLLRLLPEYDAFPKVFNLYEKTLRQLMVVDHLQVPLRLFEKKLLDRLGYGLPLEHEAGTSQPIEPDALYRFVPEQGFMRVQHADERYVTCHGRTLLALAQGDLTNQIVLKQAKLVLRVALQVWLGQKPLASRLLF